MLRLMPLLLVTLLMASCAGGAANAEATVEPSPTELPVAPAPSAPAESAQNGTFLCEVNGTPWHYTEASGIITTDHETEARTAIITFKKKLEKGSEGIQLYYDADTHELQKANVELKFPKKGGGRLTGFYILGEDTRNKLPGNSLEGSIDLSDLNVASGTGTIQNVGIRWEKELLANPEDAVVSFTNLRFSGVGYSDMAVVKEKLGL